MKKFKRLKSLKKKTGPVSNRVLLAALAGAVTGLAVTYLLESEKGRIILSQIGHSFKGFTGNLNLPSVPKA